MSKWGRSRKESDDKPEKINNQSNRDVSATLCLHIHLLIEKSDLKTLSCLSCFSVTVYLITVISIDGVALSDRYFKERREEEKEKKEKEKKKRKSFLHFLSISCSRDCYPEDHSRALCWLWALCNTKDFYLDARSGNSIIQLMSAGPSYVAITRKTQICSDNYLSQISAVLNDLAAYSASWSLHIWGHTIKIQTGCHLASHFKQAISTLDKITCILVNFSILRVFLIIYLKYFWKLIIADRASDFSGT